MDCIELMNLEKKWIDSLLKIQGFWFCYIFQKKHKKTIIV